MVARFRLFRPRSPRNSPHDMALCNGDDTPVQTRRKERRWLSPRPSYHRLRHTAARDCPLSTSTATTWRCATTKTSSAIASPRGHFENLSRIGASPCARRASIRSAKRRARSSAGRSLTQSWPKAIRRRPASSMGRSRTSLRNSLWSSGCFSKPKAGGKRSGSWLVEACAPVAWESLPSAAPA